MRTRPTTWCRSLVVILAVALLAAACQTTADAPEDGETAATAAATEGQATGVERLRLSGGDFGYPSPFAYVRGPGLIYNLMAFDTLLWKDATGEPIGWLATDWEISDDGTTWTFTLREDVSWHDGEPLTAEDVVFTFEYITEGPGKDAPAFHIRDAGVVEQATAEDERTVVLDLARPYAPFAENIAGRIPIIPQHIWEDVDNPAQLQGDEALMGSGPYTIEEANPAEGSYLFESNPDYFLGEPVVKRIELVPAEDDLLALERGEIDAGGSLVSAVPDEVLNRFGDEEYGRLEAPGQWNLALHFNLGRGFPFDSAQFRRAAAYAIDRQDMVDRLLFGRGVPAPTGGLAPEHEFTAEDLPDYARDLERARSLLDEIGLVDEDGDGMRDLPDGSAFQPQLQMSSRFPDQAGELVKEYLREVGIDVRLQALDPAAADENSAQGNYQLALVGYGGLGGDPDYLRFRFSSQVPAQQFNRAAGYENPRFDELAAQQLSTTDEQQREQLITEMQQIVAEDLPVLPLYVPDRIFLYDRSVFDAWYFTPGGVFGGYPGPLNKHVFVTGKQEGL